MQNDFKEKINYFVKWVKKIGKGSDTTELVGKFARYKVVTADSIDDMQRMLRRHG